MSDIKCYLYSDFPGARRWTLGIFAVSRHDAREYLRIYHGGHGKAAGVMTVEQTASQDAFDSMICGAVTEKAQAIMKGKNDV